MSETLQRVCYDGDPSCRVHYTSGYSDGSVWLRHFHYDTSLIIDYFRRGSGDIRIEGRLYHFSAGDMIILNPSELHMCTPSEDEAFERITLHVSEAVLEGFGGDRKVFFEAFYERERGVGNLLRADRLRECGLDRLMEEILGFAGGSRVSDAVLLRCKVIELLTRITDVSGGNEPSGESPHVANELILEILQYLNSHYREELSLSDVAETFYHSKYHVCHLFKEHMGISMNDYIALLRIRLVNNRIRKGEPISDACYYAGFHNYSNFFRIYKKHMGMTPQQFKNAQEK